MKPAPFKYYAPRSVDEAVALLGDFASDDGRILAGGQSLLPTMAFRMVKPAHLIDINRIAVLAGVDVDGKRIRIGACTRHAAFEAPGRIPGPLGALLRKVVHNIAHPPIRSRGTFCGSIANADPSSEWLCTAAALDADVIARSRRGERRIPIADYCKGVMTTDLQDDEMIVAVELPVLPEGTRSGFVEFSRRKGDFAVAMVLVTYREERGHAADVRIAVGGVEPIPRRIAEAEAVLSGAPVREETFAAVAEAVADAVTPMEDMQIAAEYRRALARTLTFRALRSAA
jgi:carbon-monoxide dehydrogenase medium subunit